MSKQKMKSNMLQTVTVVFDDGSEATFSGPAVVKGDENKKIVDVYFGEPKELPEGCSWNKVQ